MKNHDSPQEPRRDKARDTQEAMAEDAAKTNEARRDKVHGEGDTLDLERKRP